MRTIKEYEHRESKANGDTFAGLEYDSEIIGSDGVMITLFVSTGTPFAVIEQAKAEARSQRDVAGFKIEETPTCTHDIDEDCMNCTNCGACREDLDSNELCMDCGGVDENEGFSMASVLFVKNMYSCRNGQKLYKITLDDAVPWSALIVYYTADGPRKTMTHISFCNESGSVYGLNPPGGPYKGKITHEEALLRSGYKLIIKQSSQCQAEHCTMDGGNVVTTVSGDDIDFCGSCYDAYIVGLNRGMGMIIELPESIKRSRIAELLWQNRYSIDMDIAREMGKEFMIGLANGMCQALNTEPRTLEQLNEILLSQVRENDGSS